MALQTSCNIHTVLLATSDICSIYIYKAEKPSVCPSVRHADNSPGIAGFDSSGPQNEALIIRLLQVCYREFMRASVCSAK